MQTGPSEAQTTNQKPYGSGYFGEWIEDEFGLPAYRYTCDQANDPKAVTPTNTVFRPPTDHTHQVGNDRLVAACSNYGYVQVRQDEGAPKFLNDHDPEQHQYGGGFGYLTDGQTVVSTYYESNPETFERVLGVGYYRKKVTKDPYTVDQVIFAPFGDDPLLISQVTVTNGGDSPADLRWIEYWGCQQYQFSFGPMVQAFIGQNASLAVKGRRDFAKRFDQTFRVVENNAGLLERKSLRDPSASEKKALGLEDTPAVREPRYEDLSPPPTFLVSLDDTISAYGTDGAAFFGKGGIHRPDGIARELDGSLSATGPGGAFLIEQSFRLGPGESRTLRFAYGYLPEGFQLDALLKKYRAAQSSLWGDSCSAWKADGLRFAVDGIPWVEREIVWHHYYLRGNLTYDDFFGEHILSQGHVYQYVVGFQGAARDPLQHAMPFVFSNPQIVKETIRYTLKEVKHDGEIPYGITGNGMVMPAPWRPSDQEMWLLWLASEYVMATRDKAFLDEPVPTYPVYGPRAEKMSVGALLKRCYAHFVEVTGTGEFGLQRLSNGDWNDAVLWHVPENERGGIQKQGVSVLNAAMATYTLDLYATMLEYVGDAELAADARKRAEDQRKAVREQWTGRWFRRAWFTPELGWVGDDRMWLEPQPWAIIGGAATDDQTGKLVRAINELMRESSPIGARILSKALPPLKSETGGSEQVGVGTNGGVWPSINGTLIWALAKVDGKLGWDEWQKNTLARHAEAYPEVWYGLWSGPDFFNSDWSKYPGQTVFDEKLLDAGSDESPKLAAVNWTDYPVMNMHPHAWTLYTTAKLIGVEFTPAGLYLTPTLPLESYRFESTLLGFEKTSRGYAGWYQPQAGGTWTITFQPPEGETERFARLEVNGAEQQISTRDRSVIITGDSAPTEPLRWKLEFN